MKLNIAQLKGFFKKMQGSRATVPIILAIQFSLHLLGYFNTRTFSGISESGVLLGKLNEILSGASPRPLYGFYWYFTPAYVAKFFIGIFGSIDYYFAFQCLLSTATSFLIYLIVVKISGSKKSGIVSLALATVYTEYILLSSVFYNQVYENFFVLLLLLVILNFVAAGGKKEFVLYGVSALVIVMASLLFRNTLVVFFAFLLIAGVYFLFKKRTVTGAGLLTISLILFLLVFIIRPLDFLREGDYRPPRSLDFWGHTLYGGNGGEVGFIYRENEALFNERLDEYAKQNKIEEITPAVIEDFKSHEVRRFITREPHRWVLLQVKKVLNTYGIMPQRDGLTMLVRGRAGISWVMAAVLLQAPFIFIILLFIMTVDVNLNRIFRLPGYTFIMYLLGLYLIAATSVYGAWAERYRIVVMVSFIIPVTAANINRLTILFARSGRKELIIRLSVVVLMMMVWGYQAYEALVVHGDRYWNALDKMSN
jgi:hypothetical protein